jgi:hypothetical protein
VFSEIEDLYISQKSLEFIEKLHLISSEEVKKIEIETPEITTSQISILLDQLDLIEAPLLVITVKVATVIGSSTEINNEKYNLATRYYESI